MKPRPVPPGVKLHSEKAKKVFEGVRFDVYQWQQEQFDGSMATFETVKRNDSVIIIPVINTEIVIVKEQQPHWEKPAYTLIAGMVNSDEDLEVAAQRELEEETGLMFTNFKLVHIEQAIGIEWFAYTYIATGYVGQKEKKLDAGEKNEVEKISFDKLIEMTCKGEFHYHPRFVEDMIVKDKMGELREVLKG